MSKALEALERLQMLKARFYQEWYELVTQGSGDGVDQVRELDCQRDYQAIDYAIAELEKHQIPEGWKLVPMEATNEQLETAGMMENYNLFAEGASPDADHAEWWASMVDAAPEAPDE